MYPLIHRLLALLALMSSCFAFSAVNPSTGGAPKPQTLERKPIPITVLAGFLGSGKTTLLQNLLENNEGLRIAVIVNDVASVNIDSKLVKGENKAAGMVELQNGCACCSRSEELLASVSELVTLSDMRGEEDAFDHVVIELSGVADPRAIRSKFQEAVMFDMPIMDRVSLDTMVTLVDSTTFIDHLKSEKVATPDDTPELYYRDEKEAEQDRLWMDEMPAGLLEALQAGERSGASAVADLIVSQTEVADIVLITKVDLEEEAKVNSVERIVQALNPRAQIMKTVMGKVPLSRILAVAQGEGVVLAGVLDDHRDFLAAVEPEGHSDDTTCTDPGCTDTSHSHSHDHSCADPECTDSSHSHSHDHACTDPGCTDSSHSHSHDDACTDPGCTDSSHSHSHDHGETYAGIGSFVYRARRPFHPGRLCAFLKGLPVKRGVPESNDSITMAMDEASKSALKNVVRSKGFAWNANSNEAALYWSHAGSSFEMSQLGRWWATLSRDEWPEEAIKAILEDFDSKDHEEGSKTSVGDRRQEIVFIGPSLAERNQQQAISKALDQCLLNDEEWSTFVASRDNEESLKELFPSGIRARLANF